MQKSPFMKKVYKAAYVWNTLPIDLKNTVLTIDDFKKKLRKNMNDPSQYNFTPLKLLTMHVTHKVVV